MLAKPISPLFALFAAACSEPTRDLEVRVWGEAFVEDRVPADEVSDGWTIEFTEFLIAIGDVELTAADEVAVPGWGVFDLTHASDDAGHALTSVAVDGAPKRVRYWIGSPTAAPVGGNASPAQIERLRDNGWSLAIRGLATRGAESIAIDWGFALEIGHACALDQAVASPLPGAVTLTIHADHLLLDDLEHDPQLAFDVIADADADADGTVMPAELAAVDLTVMERYQSGSREIPDLWSYVGALAATMGHVDGEGECTPVFVPARHRGRTHNSAHDDDRGSEPFAQHCASCHGSQGRGDGPLADASWPRASDFTRLPAAALADDYLFFRITEGGAFFPYHSAMPAFGAALSDDEIEALVVYVQGLSSP